MIRLARTSVAVALVLLALLIGCVSGLTESEEHDAAGVELDLEGRFEEAIAEYDMAIRLDPQLASAYVNRGKAHNELGQYHLAIRDLDEAVRLDPQLILAYYNRSLSYFR